MNTTSNSHRHSRKNTVITAMLYLPIVLSLWLLAAHSLRFGHFFAFGVLLLSPLLLLIRQHYILRVCQVTLFSGGLFWIYTTYGMLSVRLAMGEDWERLLVIMGGVILFTIFSSCLCMHPRVEKHYS
ncbi:hypothetical protein [Photobacterium sanguinicancri]|uniref:hypothetical protein n=1 Tax=Photobacterium sanguinicancri TaxID=875932 RepID=UPI0026E45A2B|nr:hypothetical protein [Photobacterium sanguinicancri]MDO6496633.1 hypothetical protein [Photobacterium sanguinicancri]